MIRISFAKYVFFCAAALIVGTSGIVHSQTNPEPQPLNAIQGIVNTFDRYPVVAIAETNHGLRQAGDFYISLVKDPRFAAKVNDIVIEFGSRNWQPVVDRYINGENVSQEELQHAIAAYQRAVALDPHYAAALAGLASAEYQLADITSDPTGLNIAKGHAAQAIVDPSAFTRLDYVVTEVE